MIERHFQVTGMTCDHCVNAVRREVAAVAGIDGVDIDLASGTMVVRSQGEVDEETVLAAVREAGYEGVATD